MILQLGNIIFPEPTLTNWQFDGWTESSDPDSDTTCYKTGDKLYLDGTPETVNLYTSWGQGAITVSLYDDLGLYEYTDRDGNKLTDNIKINWRTNKKFTNLPTPSVDGFMFNGWYTAKTGGTQITNDTLCTYTSDISLYARWTANNYTVTFDTNGGVLHGSSSKTVTFNSTYGTLPTASKNDNYFIGWFTEAADGTQVDISTIVRTASNHTLYAHYEPKTTNVEFEYTGRWDSWTVPETGYYKIENWGAQGGDYGSNKGGLGGYTQGVFYLEQGTVLNINIGGSGNGSSYNGGGLKQVNSSCPYSPASRYAPAYSNGGGTTGVYVNGKDKDNLITMAGGGGGATLLQSGGKGGNTNPGTSTYINGSRGQAGGGGGYYGGTGGYVILHQHTDRNGINNGST